MSDSYRHQSFGMRTFIDASASGSSSGPDHFDMLDASQLYHEHDYPSQHVPPLQIPSHSGYGGTQFAYAPHSSNATLPGLQYTSPTMPTMAGHMPPPHYEHDESGQVGLEALDAFSPITQSYNINAYRTPYPDSNATSTSSATSPDPTHASLMKDPIIVEADEDKRKRNQAASARFRQKKKQREQQLMESTRDMQDQTKKLESENDGLRKENQFLKKLLVEKVDHMSEEDRDMLRKVTESTLNESLAKKKK